MMQGLRLSEDREATAKIVLQIRKAGEWLASARAAALGGEIRIAYRNVLRGLDVLLRNAKWTQVSDELEEMCSAKYPAEFGIGAIRFVSDAAERIPRWNLILGKARDTAAVQKKDVRIAMRGLIEIIDKGK